MSLDNFRTIELIWDKANKSIIKTIKTASSDTTGRYLSVKILDGGQEATLSNAKLQLYWEHPNFNTSGTDDFNTVNDGGLFKMTFSDEMLANVGKLNAHLVLTLPDGKITSGGFPIEVFKGANDGVVVPTNGNSALVVALEDALDKIKIIESGAEVVAFEENSVATNMIKDNAVTKNKTNFIKNGKNLFDKNNVKEGYMFDSLGNETAQAGYVISNPMPVKLNQPIYLTYGTSQPRTQLTSNRMVLFKSDGSFLQVLSGFASGDVIANTEAHTFKTYFTKNVATNFLQIEYSAATDYEDYMYSLDTSIKIGEENLTGTAINIEVEDNAVTNQKIAPQAVSEDKTTFLPIGRNKFDPEAIKNDVMLSSSGDEVANESYCITGYIPISDGDTPYITLDGVEVLSNRIVLYDKGFNKLIVLSGFASGTAINDPNTAFMRLSLTKAVAQGKFQIEFGGVTPYEEFHFQMSNRVKFGDKRLAGKTMIAFGDSITQDAHERSHYPTYFEGLTGVRYINQGYGGTTMSRHTLDEFRPFSVTNLLTAKIDNNYSAQDAVITAWESGTQEEVIRAGNYKLQLDKWKAVNLNEVYAVTMLLGANDHGATIGEINNIDPEGATFIGAYNHVIKTLQTMYPSLRIILITPIYREHAEGIVDRTPLFVQAVKDIATFNNLPVYDAYHNLGFNEYNWAHYSNDGLHPIIEIGQPRMGEAISRYLNSVI